MAHSQLTELARFVDGTDYKRCADILDLNSWTRIPPIQQKWNDVGSAAEAYHPGNAALVAVMNP